MRAEQPPVECVVEYAAKTGESPVWSAAEQALYWIDIQQPALHRFDPSTGQDRVWMMPDEIGCMALHRDGARALAGLRSGLHELSFGDGTLTLRADPPFDPTLYRFNEGGCDRTGRFWLGTMFDPHRPSTAGHSSPERDSAGHEAKGQWHSYTEREGLIAHPDFAVVPNGLGWDAEQRTMYIAHSESGIIYAFDFDAESGRLGPRRQFASIPEDSGIPDGCAIDELGGYWCALHGGGRLRRFHADGRVDRDVVLPVSHPTMCAFGGAELETLYVTSSSLKLSARQRANEPLAGRLLRLLPGVRGLPTACFGG